MLQRSLTALLLIPPVVYLVGWSPRWLFLLALIATVELGLYEFFVLSRQAGIKGLPALGYAAGGALCVAQAYALHTPTPWVCLLLILLLLMALGLPLHGAADLRGYLGAVASTVFGTIYVAVTLSCLVPLRFSEPAMGGKWFIGPGFSSQTTGRNLLLFLFLVIWAGDIFAFLVGRAIGRILLVPRVSPRKTVEGAVAGLVGSMLVAGAYAHWFWPVADLKVVILLGGLVALSAQIGDLVESALKRGANLKDSGTLLPGHGGLLDRIDSLLFGAPTLWLALTLREFWS